MTDTPLIRQILEQLEREGVTHIYGVPGGPLTPFFEAMRAHGRIRYVMARHEEGAAFMANSHARVRGGLAVCCVTSGPGATNALTGVAGAFADSLPVLYLTGQVATRMFGLGAIQESTWHGVDVVEIFRPVTKLSVMVAAAETGMRFLRHAIRTATSGRTGPVHVNIPADLARKAVPYEVQAPEGYRPRVASVPVDAELERAVKLLQGAEQPTIFAGHGVALARGEAALLRLAERAGAAVVTSPKGKSVFPEDHPLSLGVFGLGGHARADRYLEGDDVILVVGSSLNEFASSAWSARLRADTAFIQIDVDAAEIGKNYPVGVALLGDAGATMERLAARLEPPTDRRVFERLEGIAREVPRHEQEGELTSDAAPLSPPRLVAELRAAMPADGMLFVDTGNVSLWGTISRRAGPGPISSTWAWPRWGAPSRGSSVARSRRRGASPWP